MKIEQLNIFGGAETRKERVSHKCAHDDYEGFTEKFKLKKTTDDCYTPPAVYDAVVKWVDAECTPLAGRRILRPFKPGGDFEAEEYRPGDIVIDNPPFSILAKIKRFYLDRGIDFFLFAPTLQLMSGGSKYPGMTHICCGVPVTYENGAVVNTSFVTNVYGTPDIIEAVRGDLYAAVKTAQARPDKSYKKRPYPADVISAARTHKFAAQGLNWEIPREEAKWINRLDVQRIEGSTIYGNGLLLSERLAAEHAALRELQEERKFSRFARKEATEELPLSTAERETQRLLATANPRTDYRAINNITIEV